MTQHVDTTNLKPAGVPAAADLTTETGLMLEVAEAITIDSPAMYAMAGEELTSIKGKVKALTEKRLAITRPMDQAKKEVMDLFKGPLATLEKAEGLLKRSMLAYDAEQDRIRREEQRVAEEAAKAERERIDAQAREAEESGDIATAMTLQATAEMVTAAPAVVAEAPKAAGIAKTTRWSAEVTDKVAYIRHVLDTEPELLDTIEINMKPLNQLATALKDKLVKPGIKAVSTAGLSARG